jgi:hypothetical protein
MDMLEVKGILRIMQINSSNNLNQYAKRAKTGSIYLEDIRELKVNSEAV